MYDREYSYSYCADMYDDLYPEIESCIWRNVEFFLIPVRLIYLLLLAGVYGPQTPVPGIIPCTDYG